MYLNSVVQNNDDDDNNNDGAKTAAAVFKVDAYAEIFTEWFMFSPHHKSVTTLEFSPDDRFSFSTWFSLYPSNGSSSIFYEGWVFLPYSTNNGSLGFPHSPVCSPNCTYGEGNWLSLELTLVRAKLVSISHPLLILVINSMMYRWTLWMVMVVTVMVMMMIIVVVNNIIHKIDANIVIVNK